MRKVKEYNAMYAEVCKYNSVHMCRDLNNENLQILGTTMYGEQTPSDTRTEYCQSKVIL